MQNVTSGAAGMLFLGNLEDAATRVTDLTAVYPNATTDIFQLLKSEPDAPYHITGYQGYTGGDLENQINDAKIKYVIGELDLDGWKAAIEDWKAAGGEQIIKEYSEQYKAGK
ncbi:MAG: hypothetical protein E7243_14220 [Lacrimispora celerecrescens]|nr:hypothetical protein [Lacrimispora celerecrescens]